MKFDPNVEKKNPLAYYIVSFFLGMVIGFLGWQFNESTKMSTAKFGVPLIVIGLIMIGVGVYGMFTYKKRRRS